MQNTVILLCDTETTMTTIIIVSFLCLLLKGAALVYSRFNSFLNDWFSATHVLCHKNVDVWLDVFLSKNATGSYKCKDVLSSCDVLSPSTGMPSKDMISLSTAAFSGDRPHWTTPPKYSHHPLCLLRQSSATLQSSDQTRHVSTLTGVIISFPVIVLYKLFGDRIFL